MQVPEIMSTFTIITLKIFNIKHSNNDHSYKVGRVEDAVLHRVRAVQREPPCSSSPALFPYRLLSFLEKHQEIDE